MKKIFLGSIADEQIKLEGIFDEKVKEIECLLEPFGPFLEAPSFRHTESIGRCSIYSEIETNDNDFENLFTQSLKSDVDFGFRLLSRNYIIYKSSELGSSTPNIEILRRTPHNGDDIGKTRINEGV